MAAGLLLRRLRSESRRINPFPSSYQNLPLFSSPRGTTPLLRRFSAAFPAATGSIPLSSSLDPARLRNVAVIAHVDHGKTTLMDRLLRQCGADIPHERALDNISLERERGITIASKVTSISWGGMELNMVDTPGHADFGGEVERVVGMVEGAVLVVDAGEGPLAQTKFVLAKALKYGLRPLLLLNKVDRPSVSEETCDEVESLVFDLFANLGATEEQLDFPVLYASAKEGWASLTFTKSPAEDVKNMSPLLDAIIKRVPSPSANLEEPFQMLVSMMERDFYVGRILTGRISSGFINIGDRIHGLRGTDSGVEKIEEGRVTKLMKKRGTSVVMIDSAGAGDIISIAGLSSPSIGHTVANVEVATALPTVELDPPTISMTFGVNDSPLAGRDGSHLTGGKIGDRLKAESETNLAINVLPGALSESFEVQGRGELQLGILIENMRREGFELSVSPPKVMYKTENKEKLEPVEEVTVEVNEEHVGLIMEALSHRRAEVVDMGPVPGSIGRTRMSLTCPSRGLVGYRSVFSSDTRGTGFMHRAFLTYSKFRGALGNVRKGVLVSVGSGFITAHALMSLEARGTLFVYPGMETYEGMIVGEHSRDSDLEINPVRTKELTNIRAPSKDENVRLTPPRLVERVVGMVEGAVLVVDAGEGPLAQTKFVLAKALKYGLRPLLLLNKVDRPSVSEETCDEVESLVFDLFANLGATEEQLDFPVLYASAKEGWASLTFTKSPAEDVKNMSPLLDAIIKRVPSPSANLEEPFQMLVSMMERDFYVGRILTGRISSGFINIGDRIHGLRGTDSGVEKIEEGRVTKLMKKRGTSVVMIDSAGAGDIISIAGLSSPSIGHTVANVEVATALPTVELDPPTISMTFGVNDSPLAGRDGSHLTGGKIGDRLKAESETNLAINVLPGALSESFEVQGRGELQLGILIENMRREGFELSVSPPKVMYKTENKEKLEPVEEVTVEVNEEHVGLIMEALSHRRAEVVDMGPVPGTIGRTRMSLTCPSRGLVGYRSVFSSDTRGTGFMHRAFLTYSKFRGALGNVRKGVLVSVGNGFITAHALMSLEARGTLFVYPGMETYEGMIVGEHSRDSDLEINPVRTKELTNIRAPSKDENVRLTPPRLMTLEEAIGYVAADELIEVTPKAIRLRKRYLDATKRKMMKNKTKDH